ncbi:DUF4270 family protein [Chryseobacterium sp.]|uniref:DUF4270 family protein n=1 Tax=Chryseobacterium sp. TaxID=1871047 RepID=UPI00321BBA52
MTHTLKRTFAMLLLAIFGSAILYNCEPDPDSLGQQLFDKDAATANEAVLPVIAYNINNNDSIRSDASSLLAVGGSNPVAVLGAFREGQFGMQKASYITQLRMPAIFDFGDKPVVDSVVLVIRTPANTADDTYYIADKVVAPGAYDKNDFPVDNEKIAVSIEKKTYPIFKYGNDGDAFKSMKINVHQVTPFLDAGKIEFTRSTASSVVTGELLGSGVFDGKVSTVTINRKSDNTNVFKGELGFRINLDNNFFQKNILDKKGDPVLQDAANFTRYFNGIKLSVEENNGYLFQFSPNDMQLIMYYKSDKTTNGTVARSQSKLEFNFGNGNVHLGQYTYDRSASEYAKATLFNKTTGDPRIFLQGMGGPSMGITIPENVINDLREKFKTDKAAIVGAKIRVYVDTDNTFVNAQSVVASRKFTLVPIPYKPDGVTIDYSKFSFTADTNIGFPMYYYNAKKDNNPEYYDFVVTKTIKNIIEGKDGTTTTASNDPLLINLGEFVKNPTSNGSPFGARYTTRAIDMNRVLLIGSDPANAKNSTKLVVTYSTVKNK